MKIRNQIKKAVIILLIILISFILAMDKEVYSSTLDNPIVLEPTDNQYIELRAVRVNEIEGNDYQVLLEWWAHGLETSGFSIRLGYDSSVLKPSNLEDNSYYTEDISQQESSNESSNDIPGYFQFENGLEKSMDILGMQKDESTIKLIIGMMSPTIDSENESQYIKEKDGVKVLDSSTEDVLIGRMSFRSKSRDLAEDAIKLVVAEKESPKTGITVMANKYDYYENQKVFRFTLDILSTNAKLSSLTTNLAEITDFNRNTYEYTIKVDATYDEITVYPVPEDSKSTVTIKDVKVDTESGEGSVQSIKGFSELSNKKKIEILVTAEDGKTTQTYTITVLKQGGFIQGIVLTANTRGTHKATIKIYKSDQNIDWKKLNSPDITEMEEAGEIVKTAEIETNDDGLFQIILPLGKYDVLIDKPGYLDYIVKEVEIYQQHTTSIGTKEIIAGDIIKDGVIKATDQKAILKVYGKTQESEEYNVKYDFIEDGVIKATDYKILLKNYGKKKTIEQFE